MHSMRILSEDGLTSEPPENCGRVTLVIDSNVIDGLFRVLPVVL